LLAHCGNLNAALLALLQMELMNLNRSVASTRKGVALGGVRLRQDLFQVIPNYAMHDPSLNASTNASQFITISASRV
jgi:hypothetical protein